MKEEGEETESRRLEKGMNWKERDERNGRSTWFQLNTDFIIQLGEKTGVGGVGRGGCGSSKTHNFYEVKIKY